MAGVERRRQSKSGEDLKDNPSCHVCGAVMMKPWRVGRKLGRTLYYLEQLVGLVDSKEIAEMIVKTMNKSWHCRSCGATTECA